MSLQGLVTRKKIAYISLAAGVLLAAALYVLSTLDYLLFHSVAEIFSIAVAFAAFTVFWNARRLMAHDYLLVIGIAFPFIAGIDLIHTLAYRGMGVVPFTGSNVATQLWIAARGLEAITLVVASIFLKRRLNIALTMSVYLLITVLLVASIVWWQIFPVCYVEGVGLTPFKKIAEVVIASLFLVAAAMLWRHRADFPRTVYRWLMVSYVATVLSELALIFYVDVYGFSNFVGHILKIVAFVAIYSALVEAYLRQPYQMLLESRTDLAQRVAERTRELADANAQLLESESHYRMLFREMINGFAVHEIIRDAQGAPVDYRFLEVNPAFERLTGLRADDIIGQSVRQVMPDTEPYWIDRYGKVVDSGEPQSFEDYSSELGRYFQVVAYRTRPEQFAAQFHDVTEHHKMDTQLREALAEREVLLRELYHRTKNNMSVISAMLELKAMEAEDEAIIRVFQEMQGRIQAMALVHEKLYRTQNLSSIDLRAYIEDLVPLVEASHHAFAGDVNVTVEAESIEVLFDAAVPCGLILTELLSNAYKHAFKSEGEHRVDISLRRLNGNGLVSLRVADNGQGVPSDFDFRSVPSLGLQTIFALAERQLSGEIHFETEGGVACEVIFRTDTFRSRV